VTVRFVRIAGEPDRIYVKRSDGSDASWSFPTFGSEIPHDMVHLVVESMFGIRNGFWGRVDSGVDPARINQQANRKGGSSAEKYAGFGDDLTELYLAEALAALSWSVRELTPAERFEMLQKVDVDVPPAVDADALANVEHRLNELRAIWRTLLPKGTMELSF
jgi:hypothetical protein